MLKQPRAEFEAPGQASLLHNASTLAMIDERNSSHRYYLREIADKLIGGEVQKSGANVSNELEINK